MPRPRRLSRGESDHGRLFTAFRPDVAAPPGNPYGILHGIICDLPLPHGSSGQTMTEDLHKALSIKYCRRFGQLAVELGFITEAQLIEALACQVRDELNGDGHRLLGEILFASELMSAPQIDRVMTELFRQVRQEQADIAQAPDCSNPPSRDRSAERPAFSLRAWARRLGRA